MLWVSCWHFPRPRQRRPPPGRPREAAGSAGRARPSPGEGRFTVAVLPHALRGVITPALLTFLFRLYFGETYRLSLLVISLTPSSQSLVFPSQPAPPVPPGALLRPHSSHPQGRLLGSQTSPAWKVGLGGGEEMVVERRNPAHSSHFTDAEARPRLRPRLGKEGGWCENLAQRGLREHLAQVLPGTLNSQRGGHQPPGETSHLERLLALPCAVSPSLSFLCRLFFTATFLPLPKAQPLSPQLWPCPLPPLLLLGPCRLASILSAGRRNSGSPHTSRLFGRAG